MMDGRLIVREHPEQHYLTIFDQRTGFFCRKEENGYEEPNWSADGPELIDLSITNFCNKRCGFCYRRANNRYYHHLSIEDIACIVNQAKECGTMQIALGGGNPNEHPLFVPILKLIRESDIVSSYTTNGEGLTEEVLRATADFCGAMAVSVYAPYNDLYYESVVKRIYKYGIKVNLHAIIEKDTIAQWTRWMEQPPNYFQYVNAIIFLNYKPVGLGDRSLMVDDVSILEKFFSLVNRCHSVKIGFDSCSMSGVAKWMDIPEMLMEPCEAARFSMFVNEEMKAYPCSFMVDTTMCGDLRKNHLADIWQNNFAFKSFRKNLPRERCVSCTLLNKCQGSCRFMPEINFCER